MSDAFTRGAHDPTFEFRLGLVMYGGVSLAIYIYGVASELFHAVLGDTPEYRALKKLLRSEIVVDVMSGASAGGVNAVLLGRALANPGSDFDVCADLWREKADFVSLLEEPLAREFESGADVPTALFRSKAAYQDELERALRKVRATTIRFEEPPLTSPVRELDVFLTGTDIYGRRTETEDARHARIHVKDHRVVFHLKHRKDGGQVRKSAFHPTDDLSEEAIVSGLAAIARTTSAFPVAFRPVEYDPEGDLPYVVLMKKALRGHAQSQKAWLTDGGVLDNKPFTQTIDTIYHRSTGMPVDRKIFYVEPDPERFARAKAEEPRPESVALAAVTSIPGYESIANDIAKLEEHNRKVRMFQDLIRSVSPRTADPTLYDNARRIAWIARIEAAMDEAAIGVGPSLLAGAREAAKEIAAATGGADVDRAMRRHFHVIYRLYAERDDTGRLARREEIELLFAQVERLEIVRSAVDRVIAEGLRARGDDAILANLRSIVPRIRRVLAPVAAHALEDKRALYVEMKGRVGPEAPGEGSVVEQIVAATKDAIERRGWKGLDLFTTDFDRLDAWLYPLQAASGVESQDAIELVRISPFDATGGYGADWGLEPKQKISGDAMFHFGGFIKRSWRSNDIFWGKCDASEILIDTLLSSDRFEEALRFEDFPSRLEDAVSSLCLERGELDALALDPKDPAGLRDALRGAMVKSAHRRIARHDVPKVAYDLAVEEEQPRPEDRELAEDSVIRLEIEEAARAGKWRTVDGLARRFVAPLGDEDLGDVAPLQLGRVVSQTGVLVAKIMRERSKDLRIVGRLGEKAFGALESSFLAAYVLARSLEINAFLNALIVTALGTAFGTSLLMVVLDVSSRRVVPRGWHVAVVLGTALAFTFARHVLAVRIEPKAYRVPGLFGRTPFATWMIALLAFSVFGVLLFAVDPVSTCRLGSDLLGAVGRSSGIVCLELAGDRDTAAGILSAWETADQIRYAWLSLVLDLPFIASYATLLYLTVLAVGRRVAHIFRDRPDDRPVYARWMRVVAYLVASAQVVAAVLDLAENVALANILWTLDPTESFVWVAYVCASIKFALILNVGVPFIVVGAAFYVILRAYFFTMGSRAAIREAEKPT
jgi:predicted acylesterase/phospholipase RssA